VAAPAAGAAAFGSKVGSIRSSSAIAVFLFTQ